MTAILSRVARMLPVLVLLGSPASVLAAPCGGSFNSFIAAFSRDAAAHGISKRVLASAFAHISADVRVIALDRRQGVFRQSFERFGPPRVAARLARGRQLMARHARLLARIEQRFGVPGPVLIAIWGLETDFGADSGHYPVIRSLATLAHDCRRSAKFQGELLAALTIVQRGDLSAARMQGAWAGELGQTQFLPSSYVKFAVDFDGNGRRDLIHSVPDVLASTANYLHSYGWQRGGAWTEGSRNFVVLREWNRAEVYRKTIALFATRLAQSR